MKAHPLQIVIFMIAKLELKKYDEEYASKILSTKKQTDRRTAKALWHFKGNRRNPDYQKGIIKLKLHSETARVYHKEKLSRQRKKQAKENKPFDTCLIYVNDAKTFDVKTVSKWSTTLGYYDVDIETGELIQSGEYATDEIKQSNGKKIASMDAFARAYSDAYRLGRISLLFHTFTRANYAKMTFRRMLSNVGKRYKSIGFNVVGYVWTAEVSDRGHWHYHLVVAIDRRMNVRGTGLSKKLMLEELWGQRTEIEFVKKNVRHYMAKYFAKHNARVIGTRSFGKSKKFII